MSTSLVHSGRKEEPNPERIRPKANRGMVAFGVANVLLAAFICAAGSFGYSVAATVSFSRFRDLCLHEAVRVDPVAARGITNAGLNDPDDIPRFLNCGLHDLVLIIDLAATVALLANGVLWVVVGVRRRGSTDDLAAIHRDGSNPKP